MNSLKKEPSLKQEEATSTWSNCGLDPNTDSYIGSDVHLESLGLSMDRGKPKFKVNEECSNHATSSMSLLNLKNVKDQTPSESFVVLSHPSLEMLQAQSLANYIQVQEKTSSIDYNSIISNMSPLEIEEKLAAMLHENAKLKETIIENNEAMKKQFNSLAAWQEAVSSVHQNHKQKFTETRELVDQLKKENATLRVQLFADQLRHDPLCKMTSNSVLKNLTEVCNCSHREELAENLSKRLVESINNFENCEQSKQNSCKDLTETCESLKELHINQNLGSDLLKEVIINLGEKSGTINKNASTSMQTLDYTELIERLIPQAELRKQLIDNVKPYHESMEEFVNYFSVQSSRYIQLQESLKNCTDVLRNLETKEDSVAVSCKSSLSECQKKLFNEQLENIADRQKWIGIKNQLQKIFFVYTSTLCELELLKEENRKILTIQSRDSQEKLEQEKQFLEEKAAIEEEMKRIALEKLSLVEEKETINKLRETLLANQENLNVEIHRLNLEKLNLVEEKTALDRQSKLYEEQEKEWSTEKKNVMKTAEEINLRVIKLEEDLKKQNESTYSDKENLMVLRAQLDIYRTDFEQEKTAKKNLIRDKNKLIEQIQALTVQNQELRKDINKLRQQIQDMQGISSSANIDSSTSSDIQLFTCPLCFRKFSTIEPLEEHANECISLIEQG